MATVSRVLNGISTVNSDLRLRVECAMHDLRFRPNRLAQNLYHHRSNTIGCILPDIVNPFFAQIFMQLEVKAFECGYTIILGNTVSTRELERTYLRTLAEQQVDGLVVLGGLTNDPEPPPEDIQLMQELAERLPIVTVNGDLADVNIISSVRSDESGGMSAILSHLHEQGHTDVAFLGGRPDVTNTLDKLSVYQGFSPHHPPEWVQLTGLSIESGVEALKQLLHSSQRPTAAVCANDLVAAGVLMAAREHGLNVPKDLSVVGFDDIFLAQVVTPALTTVNHNYSELARRALNALLASIEGESPDRTINVPTFLVKRESVALHHPQDRRRTSVKSNQP
ncbi:LacI family DNA-binding transcriptional regulator [Deinococcus sp. QL22]|uniref:LacI family DNA-binding transcriptional regulator n=1 Tax=Deinococcus sp. QL22 TaxID=2939437 RepID=UPI002016FC4E|nr:LacI family DNA-binding transcriptional regulator [Deinococcus sp. QL22]UQN09831.1 LacI family transcriptional regulator [Deinococcus sp. QL22]